MSNSPLESETHYGQSVKYTFCFCAAAGCLAGATLAPSSPYHTPLLLCGGFLAGAAAADLFFRRRLSRAAAVLRQQQAPLSTGVAAFDAAIAEMRRRDQHFLETMASAGDATERLTERYQMLTENLAASVVIRDTAGRISYCSPYTEVLTGYALSEIYEAPDDFFLSIVHEDDRENLQRALKISMCGEAFQCRYRFFHKSGLEMWAETRAVPVFDATGEVTTSLAITLDVTGSVRYQRQVEERNRELQDLSYMITHDLKAPILTIKGMLGVLEEDYHGQLKDGVNEVLAHIRRATSRLEQLVASVLRYTKISVEEPDTQVVDLNKVVREVLADFEPGMRKESIEAVVAGPLPSVVGDETKFYQVFSNLIGNAVKYRAKERPSKIEIRAVTGRRGRFAAIEVVDNGIGIPAGKLQDVFRPFQRAHDKEAEGSGIGLASAKRMLEKLGGRIEVASTEGAGSTFTLYVRRDESQT